MSWFRGVFAILISAVLVGCGGAASTPSASSKAAGPATTGVASATIQITVPAPSQTTTSSATRRAAFVSPSTKSISIVIAGATFNEDLSPAAAGCTASTPAGAFSCALTVTAPVGTASLTAKTYSAVAEGGSLLSNTALTFTALQEGTANVVPLVLDAVPASVSVASLPPPNEQYYVTNGANATLYGTDSVQVAVQAFDAGGNMIIGPGSPTYTLGDASNPNLSIGSVANTSNVFTLTATTPGNDVTLTATATPAIGAPVTATIPLALRHITIAATSTSGPPYHMYLYNDRSSTATTTITNGLDVPTGVAFDANQTLYVANDFGANVPIYPFLATSPSVTIAGTFFAAPVSVAVDPAGTLYVADIAFNTVQTFAAQASAPNASTYGPFLGALGVAVSKAGQVAVVDSGQVPTPKIFVYPSGSTTSSYSITLAGASGVAYDRAGDIWVAATTGVYEYAPGATTSSYQITAGLGNPVGVAVDIAGYVYIADYSSSKVFVFAPGNNTAPIETIPSVLAVQGIAVYPN